MLTIRCFVCNAFQENCYVVSDETGEAVIIDCGAFFPEERKAIVDYIRNSHLNPSRLLATHGHFDHNYGNNTIYHEFGLKVEVNEADEQLINTLPEQSLLFSGTRIDYQLPPVGNYLKASDIVTFGKHQLSLIPTPGHTPGSMFIYCASEGVAFSGDTLFRMSIGRTDFELGSYEDIMDSLKNIKSILPHETKIYCGHGLQTVLRDEISMNPYLRV